MDILNALWGAEDDVRGYSPVGLNNKLDFYTIYELCMYVLAVSVLVKLP